MKAAQFNSYGSPDVIEINPNANKPAVKSGQILVEVHAAGINPIESAIRNGNVQQMLKLDFPANTGGDFSGVILEVGANVPEFNVGAEVYGIASQFKGGSGAAAEFASANASNVGFKPKSVDHTQAAALPLVGTSALQAIEEHIKLQSGQKILIQGGAGGIGSLAVQLAKSLGAFVAATAATDDVGFVKSLGADEVIDYKSQDFTKVIKDYDAVFDTVGGETTNKSLEVLKKGGILVTMSGQPDEEKAKELEVTVIKQMTQGTTEQLNKLAELVDKGTIKPQVTQTFPLDQTKEAYTLMETKHPKGKIVISVR